MLLERNMPTGEVGEGSSSGNQTPISSPVDGSPESRKPNDAHLPPKTPPRKKYTSAIDGEENGSEDPLTPLQQGLAALWGAISGQTDAGSPTPGLVPTSPGNRASTVASTVPAERTAPTLPAPAKPPAAPVLPLRSTKLPALATPHLVPPTPPPRSHRPPSVDNPATAVAAPRTAVVEAHALVPPTPPPRRVRLTPAVSSAVRLAAAQADAITYVLASSLSEIDSEVGGAFAMLMAGKQQKRELMGELVAKNAQLAAEKQAAVARAEAVEVELATVHRNVSMLERQLSIVQNWSDNRAPLKPLLSQHHWLHAAEQEAILEEANEGLGLPAPPASASAQAARNSKASGEAKAATTGGCCTIS